MGRKVKYVLNRPGNQVSRDAVVIPMDPQDESHSEWNDEMQ